MSKDPNRHFRDPRFEDTVPLDPALLAAINLQGKFYSPDYRVKHPHFSDDEIQEAEQAFKRDAPSLWTFFDALGRYFPWKSIKQEDRLYINEKFWYEPYLVHRYFFSYPLTLGEYYDSMRLTDKVLARIKIRNP